MITVELFLNDLSKAGKAKLQAVGFNLEDPNWDTMPIVVLEYEDIDVDVESNVL